MNTVRKKVCQKYTYFLAERFTEDGVDNFFDELK